MNQAQKDMRRAAARAFMESLDVLACRLSTEAEDVKNTSSSHPSSAPLSCHDSETKTLVQEFEDAVADIEQFNQG